MGGAMCMKHQPSNKSHLEQPSEIKSMRNVKISIPKMPTLSVSNNLKIQNNQRNHQKQTNDSKQQFTFFNSHTLSTNQPFLNSSKPIPKNSYQPPTNGAMSLEKQNSCNL
jgi:hypothetical protein